MPSKFDIKVLYQILTHLDSVGWNIGTITHKGDNVFEIVVESVYTQPGLMAGTRFTGHWKVIEDHVVCTWRNDLVMS